MNRPHPAASRCPPRRAAVLAGLLFLLVIGPADAAVRRLDWGMTPQDVLLATGGTPRLDPDRARYNTDAAFGMFVLRHRFLGFPFDARFLFDRGTRGLSRLHLTLRAPERCDALHAALGRRYGPERAGIPGQFFAFAKWYVGNRHEVAWSRVAGQCTLEAWPLPPPIPPDP